MQLKTFPHCCGACMIYGLYIDTYFRNTYRKNKIKFINGIHDKIITACGQRKGIMLAITNNEQRNSVIIMKKFGFKKLKRFFNPNVNTNLTLWQLNLNSVIEEHMDNIATKLINSL